jgi:hypothetical protein
MARTPVDTTIAPQEWTIRFSGEYIPAVDGRESGEITISGDGPTSFAAVVNDGLVLAIRDAVAAHTEVENIDVLVVSETKVIEHVVPDEPTP